jgi:L-serine dehydratase
MRAAKIFCEKLRDDQTLNSIDCVKAELYGSLGQTGKGHGTGKAVILGLMGFTPEAVDVSLVDDYLKEIDRSQRLNLFNHHMVKFPREGAITFHRRKTLPLHSNGMAISAFANGQLVLTQTYYSIGGGFIVNQDDFQSVKNMSLAAEQKPLPYSFASAAELIQKCKENGLSISSLMLQNEATVMPKNEVIDKLWHIWQVMLQSVDNGIHSEGILPGGLKVTRRAPALYRRLETEQTTDPMQAMDWVNLFALAVNEENAAGGRVVTAPTNGAAGIIPAVLCYFDKFVRKVEKHTAARYLLTAAAIGILYKKNASISGAEVGCQGEVGVACSMAAGALTEIIGGSVDAVENAAEIGMEHNLGLTCDPVGGLVQVPCIERNAMGAIKAINASRLALRGTGQHKVSLDKVIKTMWDTGNDMKSKYKETARGGLAVNIIEC